MHKKYTIPVTLEKHESPIKHTRKDQGAISTWVEAFVSQ